MIHRWFETAIQQLYNGGLKQADQHVFDGPLGDRTTVIVSKWHVCKQMFTTYLAAVWVINLLWSFLDSYTMDDIILNWLSDNKGSVSVSHDLKIPQYTLVSWEQTSQVQEYSTGILNYFTWSSIWWNTMNIFLGISSGFSHFLIPFLSWITRLLISLITS